MKYERNAIKKEMVYTQNRIGLSNNTGCFYFSIQNRKLSPDKNDDIYIFFYLVENLIKHFFIFHMYQ